MGAAALHARFTYYTSLIIPPLSPCCVARQLTKLIWMLFCCSVMFSPHSVLSCTFCSVSMLNSLSHLISSNPYRGLSIPFTYGLRLLCFFKLRVLVIYFIDKNHSYVQNLSCKQYFSKTTHVCLFWVAYLGHVKTQLTSKCQHSTSTSRK